MGTEPLREQVQSGDADAPGSSDSASIHPVPKPPKHRSISRELALMAAAIVVLVLVGGVLALVFHEQRGGDQGGIAAGGTPSAVAGAELPMTVTANGVALQLQSVDSTDTVTRFSFMLQLGNVQLTPHQPFGAVLSSDPTGNVTIDGITPGPNDPYESESDGVHDSHPIISFTLDYQSPFPADRTVTITFQHLMVPIPPATPASTPGASTRQVDGPWTFRITPSMVAKQPEPTPFSAVDRFAGVSAASAQKWTSFPIVAPTPLPAALSQGQQQQINAFNVIGFGLGAPETAPANYVLFTYQPPFGSAVYLAETTNDAAVPKISGNTASVLMPLEPDKPQTIEIAPNTLSTLNIESVRVTRFQVLATDTSSNTIYYVWNAGGVNHALWQVVTPLPAGMKGVSDSDLRQMVTSIIQQRAGSNAATATPYVPAASPLPLTVSASGLRITLLAGLRDGHEIVLNFKIEPSDPNQPNLWELGGGAMLKGIIPAEDDVEATGLQWDSQNQAAQIIVPLVPRGTKPQPTPEIPGYTESLPFVLTGQANQPVTVTIHRVRFDHAPSAPPPGKVIDGTWTFTFMPASLPSPASSGSPVP